MTGMRRGEVLGLRWQDIDFDHARLAVRQTLISISYRPEISTPKTHRSRVVDLDAKTLEMLRKLHGTAVDRRGPRLSSSATKAPRSTLRACVSCSSVSTPHAAVPRIRFHDLCHTQATIARAGVPVKVISERLGHATPTFTLQQYAHVIPGMQAEAASQIADLVDGSTCANCGQPSRSTDGCICGAPGVEK